MAKEFTLGKNERLKSRKAIDHLFKEGKRFTVSPFRVFYCEASPAELLVGAGAGTKSFKKAVDRNRIKRLVREAWRLQKNPLKEKLLQEKRGLHVFLIYTDKDLPGYEQVFVSVKNILEKLNKLLEK